MGLRSTYLTGVLGGALAALCFVVALAAMPAVPGSKSDPSIEPQMSDTVNRGSKGDRLKVIVRPPPFEVQTPDGSSPKLLDGCESAFSQMDHSSAKLAQTCTT
jgi:hypothetical protein